MELVSRCAKQTLFYTWKIYLAIIVHCLKVNYIYHFAMEHSSLIAIQMLTKNLSCTNLAIIVYHVLMVKFVMVSPLFIVPLENIERQISASIALLVTSATEVVS